MAFHGRSPRTTSQLQAKLTSDSPLGSDPVPDAYGAITIEADNHGQHSHCFFSAFWSCSYSTVAPDAGKLMDVEELPVELGASRPPERLKFCKDTAFLQTSCSALRYPICS